MARTGQVFKSKQDCIKDAIFTFRNLVGPKSDHAKAPGSKPFRAFGVMSQLRGLRVLNAIDFDNESFFKTHKVDHEYADRVLASKAVSAELPVSQAIPKRPFALAHIAAQSSSAFVGHAIIIFDVSTCVTPTCCVEDELERWVLSRRHVSSQPPRPNS